MFLSAAECATEKEAERKIKAKQQKTRKRSDLESPDDLVGLIKFMDLVKFN